MLQIWKHKHRGRTPTASGPQNDPYVRVPWVTWPNFENLGHPYNCWTNSDTRFKFGRHIHHGPLLRPDHEMTPKWAWPRSRDQISKFWEPPNKFWKNRAICFKFGKNIEDGPLLRLDHKTTPKWACPRSRDQISKFWDPPNNFWTNRAIRFKFCTDIEYRPLLRLDHKTTPKWTWPRSRDRISKFWDPLITFEQIEQSDSNLVHT